MNSSVRFDLRVGCWPRASSDFFRSFRFVLAMLAACGLASMAVGNVTLQSPGGTVGQVQLVPHVYVVYWAYTGHDPAHLAVDINWFLDDIGGTPWNGTFGEYGGIGYIPPNTAPVGSWPQNGQLTKGTWNDDGQTITGLPAYLPPPPDIPEAPNPSDPNGIFSDPNAWLAAVHNEAIRAAKFFKADSDPNAIIVVASPPRKYSIDTYTNGVANHGDVNAGGSLPTAYIDLRYPGHLDKSTGAYVFSPTNIGDPASRVSISSTLQHEINESITDPRPHSTMAGWADPGFLGGGEVDDLETLLGGGLQPTRDGNGCLQVKLLENSASTQPEDTIFTITPGWSNFMATMFASAHGISANPDNVDAALWAWSNNISSDQTYTPARFSISPAGHLMFLGWDNSDSASPWKDWGSPAGTPGLLYPTAVSWRLGRLDAFALGQLTVGGISTLHLFHIYSNDHGSTRSAWEDWGTLPSGNYFRNQQIAVTCYGPQQLDLFATSSLGELWGRRRSYESSGWADSGWIDLGTPPGGIASGPGAVVWLTNYAPHVRVYVINSAGKLCNTQFDGWGSPSPQAWVIDTLSTAPALRTVNPAVANRTSPRTFDIVALDTSGNVWHRAFYSPLTIDEAGTELSPIEFWENWGHPAIGAVTTAPAVTSLASRMLLVDVRGADGNIYEMARYMVGLVQQGTSGSWVNQLGAPTTGGIAVTDF